MPTKLETTNDPAVDKVTQILNRDREIKRLALQLSSHALEHINLLTSELEKAWENPLTHACAEIEDRINGSLAGVEADLKELTNSLKKERCAE